MKKTLVYIAGPYRANTISGVRRNIEAARAVAEQLWARGHPCICPHLNSAFMDGLTPEADFLEGDLLILSKCNAVVLVGDWLQSAGTRREIAHAVKCNIPIYATPEDLYSGSPMSLDHIGNLVGWVANSI